MHHYHYGYSPHCENVLCPVIAGRISGLSRPRKLTGTKSPFEL